MRVALAPMDVWSLASLWVGRADPMSRAAAMPTREDIRNVAIVAHIGHHNTTLVDACFGSCENQDVAERVNAKSPVRLTRSGDTHIPRWRSATLPLPSAYRDSSPRLPEATDGHSFVSPIACEWPFAASERGSFSCRCRGSTPAGSDGRRMSRVSA
jgi:hypothetical protein